MRGGGFLPLKRVSSLICVEDDWENKNWSKVKFGELFVSDGFIEASALLVCVFFRLPTP